MERSDKHGPLRDDAMAGETEGLVRSGHGTHAEEWRDPEPPGEDQPEGDWAPNTTLSGGTPAGMSEADVVGRSELAQYLADTRWPADRTTLEAAAERSQAPDWVLRRLAELPESRAFEGASQVWAETGGGIESHRF